ncbi:hypothetical protein NC652_038712 [Populus alba x Populus x berolinensis]|nr:hypothetical protein NC652_038712 [Populus alba x Populus x berolinensis]
MGSMEVPLFFQLCFLLHRPGG